MRSDALPEISEEAALDHSFDALQEVFLAYTTAFQNLKHENDALSQRVEEEKQLRLQAEEKSKKGLEEIETLKSKITPIQSELNNIRQNFKESLGKQKKLLENLRDSEKLRHEISGKFEKEKKELAHQISELNLKIAKHTEQLQTQQQAFLKEKKNYNDQISLMTADTEEKQKEKIQILTQNNLKLTQQLMQKLENKEGKTEAFVLLKSQVDELAPELEASQALYLETLKKLKQAEKELSLLKKSPSFFSKKPEESEKSSSSFFNFLG